MFILSRPGRRTIGKALPSDSTFSFAADRPMSGKAPLSFDLKNSFAVVPPDRRKGFDFRIIFSFAAVPPDERKRSAFPARSLI